jgi:hypothetical protein
MATFKITDPTTGQTLRMTADDDTPPTEGEIRAAFSSVKGTRTVGNPDASPSEKERMRREWVAKEGTVGTRVKDYLNSATPRAESLSDFGSRVVPESLGKLVPRIANAGWESIRGQTDPLVKAFTSEFGNPQYRPGDEMAANAKKSVRSLAEAMTAPTGLMGMDRAQEAWLTDPAGSALAISPLVKPGLRGAGAVADTATAIPRAALADIARKSANKLTDMTLKQSTTLKPEVRAKNVQTAHEGGFLPTSKGVDKLNATITQTENALREGIAAGDAAQVKGTLDKAVANVEALREKANMSSEPEANNALIDAEILRLRSHPLLDASGQIDIGSLQKMKVAQGRELAKTYGGEKATQFQNTIDKSRVRGMKEELESALDGAFPELAATNKKLGEYYNLKKSLERAANRIENNQGIGIGLPIKGGAGATMGGMIGGPAGAAVGGGIGTLIGVIEHPSVAPRLAQQLYKASKGAMTMNEATAMVKQRLGRLRDDRGLVGRDIGGGVNISKEFHPETREYLSNKIGELQKEFPATRNEVIDFVTDKRTGNLEHDGFTGELRMNPSLSKWDTKTLDRIYTEWGAKSEMLPGLNASINHEFAHLLDGRIKKLLKTDEAKEAHWNKIKELEKQFGHPSKYSKKGTHEWLAERFAYEIENPVENGLIDYLKSITPTSKDVAQ